MPPPIPRVPDWFLDQLREKLELKPQKTWIEEIEASTGYRVSEPNLSKWKTHGRIPPEWIEIFTRFFGITPAGSSVTPAPPPRIAGPDMLALGRDSDLAMINSAFSGDAAVSVVTIVGEPGTGKSSLAKEYHRRRNMIIHRDNLKALCPWLRVIGPGIGEFEEQVFTALGLSVPDHPLEARDLLVEHLRNYDEVLFVIDSRATDGPESAAKFTRILSAGISRLQNWLGKRLKARFLVVSLSRLEVPGERLVVTSPVSIAGFAEDLVPAMDWTSEAARGVKLGLSRIPEEFGCHPSGLELFLTAIVLHPQPTTTRRFLTEARATANLLLADAQKATPALAREAKSTDARFLGTAMMRCAFGILSARAQELLIRLSAFEGPFRISDVLALGQDLLCNGDNPIAVVRNLVQLRWLDREGTRSSTYDGYYLAAVKQRFLRDLPLVLKKGDLPLGGVDNARTRLCEYLTNKAQDLRVALNSRQGAREIESLRCYIPTVTSLLAWCAQEGTARSTLGLRLLLAWWHPFESVGALVTWERRFYALMVARYPALRSGPDAAGGSPAAGRAEGSTSSLFSGSAGPVVNTLRAILLPVEQSPDSATRARPLADVPLLCEAFYRQAIALSRGGRFEDARHWLELARVVAEKHQDHLNLARIHYRLAVISLADGLEADYTTHLDAAARFYFQTYGAAGVREQARILYWRARGAWVTGAFSRCQELLEESQEWYRAADDLRGEADVLCLKARCAACTGDWQGALQYADTASLYAEVVGGRVPNAQARMMLGLALFAMGDPHPEAPPEPAGAASNRVREFARGKNRARAIAALEEAATCMEFGTSDDLWWAAWMLAEIVSQLKRLPAPPDDLPFQLASLVQSIRAQRAYPAHPEAEDRRFAGLPAVPPAAHPLPSPEELVRRFRPLALRGIQTLKTSGSAADPEGVP